VLNIRVMLTGDVNRLRYVTRHSTSLVLHREGVAEHTAYVAIYSMFICDWIRKETERRDINELQVLRRALIHDMDEARTGDFQRPFKYSNPQLKDMLDAAAEQEIEALVLSLFDEPTYATRMAVMWANAKDSTNEGAIVAFADYLSVVSYLYAEVTNANSTVVENYQTMRDYTAIFMNPRYDFIRPLVDQTIDLVKEIMKRAGHSISL